MVYHLTHACMLYMNAMLRTHSLTYPGPPVYYSDAGVSASTGAGLESICRLYHISWEKVLVEVSHTPHRKTNGTHMTHTCKTLSYTEYTH